MYYSAYMLCTYTNTSERRHIQIYINELPVFCANYTRTLLFTTAFRLEYIYTVHLHDYQEALSKIYTENKTS